MAAVPKIRKTLVQHPSSFPAVFLKPIYINWQFDPTDYGIDITKLKKAFIQKHTTGKWRRSMSAFQDEDNYYISFKTQKHTFLVKHVLDDFIKADDGTEMKEMINISWWIADPRDVKSLLLETASRKRDD